MNDSYSSFSSLNNLSFILEEPSEGSPMLDYVPDNEIDIKTIELLMKFRQTR